ncbi:MAG TPA: hypothetical protein DCP58_08500, partial [Verrucomicrobiales bacterium]|nr:hypothetical protein [Verrucomicrobiales bacterium]
LLAKKGELDAEKAKLVRQFESAWEIYASGQFAEAKSAFEACLKIMDDEPSRIYAAQCEQFIKNPPPEGWAGEWIQLTK